MPDHTDQADVDTCVTCGCSGLGTTTETGCTCPTCHAQPGDQLGWLEADLSKAYDSAIEISIEWRTRLRLARDSRGYWIASVPPCECEAYTIRTDYGTGTEHDVDRSSCRVHAYDEQA